MWLAKARPDQIPPPDGDWDVFLNKSGRGAGKTRAGAEWFGWQALRTPFSRGAIVAPTFADARDTCVEGESGLLSTLPPSEVLSWNRSLGELTLKNGSRIKLFSADAANRLRGPQHHFGWCDELAAWSDPDAWDQLLFGMRLGTKPRIIVTTTPRPTRLVTEIINDPTTIVVTGSTFDNAANLAPSALAKLKRKYEGTRLGRQELYGDVLTDVPGALWTVTRIDELRAKKLPDLARVVVSVDPSGQGNNVEGDTIGIVVAGLGVDGIGYVIADYSCDLPPAGWGRRAVDAYHKFEADLMIAERNFGGAMVHHVIATTDRNIPYKEVTASRGKSVRAEPISALYEQGRVRHLGVHRDLEDQMCSMTSGGFIGNGSPDRLDAMVWALTELMLGDEFQHGFA